MNTACSRKGENKIVMQWENSLLLPGCTGMLKNVGLAGAYSGIVEDKLLVLGGANFPDKYPWEGGVKTWCLADFAADLPAIHFGHHDVEDDEGDVFLGVEGVYGLFAVTGFDDVVSGFY